MLEADLCYVDIAEPLGVSCGTSTHLAAYDNSLCGTVDDLPA